MPAEDEVEPPDQAPPQPRPYLFSPAVSTVFDDEAFKVVNSTLTAFSHLPYRFDDQAALMGGPQELAKSYLAARQLEQRR
jgi:hypothetical protein